MSNKEKLMEKLGLSKEMFEPKNTTIEDVVEALNTLVEALLGDEEDD